MKLSEHFKGAALAAGLALSGANLEGCRPVDIPKPKFSKRDLTKLHNGIYNGAQIVAEDENYLYFRISNMDFVAVPRYNGRYIDSLEKRLQSNLDQATTAQERKKIKESFEERFKEKLIGMAKTALK